MKPKKFRDGIAQAQIADLGLPDPSCQGELLLFKSIAIGGGFFGFRIRLGSKEVVIRPLRTQRLEPPVQVRN